MVKVVKPFYALECIEGGAQDIGALLAPFVLVIIFVCHLIKARIVW